MLIDSDKVLAHYDDGELMQRVGIALRQTFPSAKQLSWMGLAPLDQITYKVVKHDGGWAYEVNGTYSEPFPTRNAARKAAKLAASEQAASGETTRISYEDEKGRWHNEVDSRTDRPKTTVQG